MPQGSVWEYIGPELKSELARFAGDGYDNLLYVNHELSISDTVLVLGGYKGKSIKIWRNSYNCNVVAYEPIPAFFELLKHIFAGDQKVSLQPFAVSDKEESILFALAEEGTSAFLATEQNLTIAAKDIDAELKRIYPFPVIIEMNIEGGEYAVLKRMLQTQSIRKVQTLLIQFHNYGYEQELERAQVRLALSETHFCEFSYEWLWEKWTLKS